MLNKGFQDVKTTSDIILPSNLKTVSSNELDLIKNKIDESINSKDLTKLFEVYNLILE